MHIVRRTRPKLQNMDTTPKPPYPPATTSKNKDGREAVSIHIYTDGACAPNPGMGGWSFVSEKWTGQGCEEDSTNNRMEMMAVYQALDFHLSMFDKDTNLIFYCDSAYVVQPFNQKWLETWKANNWTRKGGGLKNIELWQAIEELYTPNKHRIQFIQIRGHSGDTYNDLADKLAVESRLKKIDKSIKNVA